MLIPQQIYYYMPMPQTRHLMEDEVFLLKSTRPRLSGVKAMRRQDAYPGENGFKAGRDAGGGTPRP